MKKTATFGKRDLICADPGAQLTFPQPLQKHSSIYAKKHSHPGKLTFRQFHEIFQQLQADLLAFLRVKLRGINIVAPDG